MKRTGTDLLFVGAGFFLVMGPALPVARWVGARDIGPPWPDYLVSWMLGSIIVTALALIGGRYLKSFSVPIPAVRFSYVVGALALVATVATFLVSSYSFEGNPHLIDEMAQLFHARVFLSGRLAAPVPDHPEFFLLPNTFIAQGGWISQYPPGGSALLALSMMLGSPALLNPILAGVGTVLVFILGRNLCNEKVGLLGALLWATSPWVLAMSATYMSHTPATTFALGAWAVTMRREAVSNRLLMLAGLLLAACAATRPLDALIAMLPLALWFAALDRRWRTPLYMLLGGAPILGVWFWVNWRTMGHPLAMGYIENFGVAHRPGFHVDPFGNPFTISDGVANLSSGLRRLNIYLFEWPIPALLPLIAWALFAKGRSLSDMVLLVGAFAAPLVYMFYFHSGFYPGPRFYYLGVPFLVLGTARAFFWMLRGGPERRGFSSRSAVITASVAVWAWGTFGLATGRFAFYRNSLGNLKVHPNHELQARNVKRALVLVPESWGSRVMARMWGKGVPSSLAERAYRSFDLCDLDSLISAEDGETLESDLEAAVRSADPVPLIGGLPDPTLRIRSVAGLRPECAAELRRDLEGFALYPPLGWMNPVDGSDGIVYARDLFQYNEPLMQRYPDSPVWRFSPPAGFPDSLPRLERIR